MRACIPEKCMYDAMAAKVKPVTTTGAAVSAAAARDARPFSCFIFERLQIAAASSTPAMHTAQNPVALFSASALQPIESREACPCPGPARTVRERPQVSNRTWRLESSRIKRKPAS